MHGAAVLLGKAARRARDAAQQLIALEWPSITLTPRVDALRCFVSAGFGCMQGFWESIHPHTHTCSWMDRDGFTCARCANQPTGAER